ncbi:MAG: hypothetical protein VXZ38_07245 [Planctomycetota bacterium]|nr:hypothetical protein [Planctomycetota bacterium]
MATQQIVFDFGQKKKDIASQSHFADQDAMSGLLQDQVSSEKVFSKTTSSKSTARQIKNLPGPIQPKSRSSIMQQLREQTGCIQHVSETAKSEIFSTGIISLDHWLPSGGLKLDTITEWVNEREGSGAITLACLAVVSRLKSQPRSMGPVVIVSEESGFYPPSAMAFGVPAQRMLWVRTRGWRDQIWAVDQALRCRSISAVLAVLPNGLDDRDARRFQLASEQGKTTGFFIRTAKAKGQPCFSEVRFLIDSCRDERPRFQSTQIPAAPVHNAESSRSRFSGDFRIEGGRSRKNVKRFAPANLGAQPTGFPENRYRQFQITLERCRGGQVGQQARFQMDDFGDVQEVATRNQVAENHGETTLHLVSKLANPENSKFRQTTVECAG